MSEKEAKLIKEIFKEIRYAFAYRNTKTNFIMDLDKLEAKLLQGRMK